MIHPSPRSPADYFCCCYCYSCNGCDYHCGSIYTLFDCYCATSYANAPNYSNVQSLFHFSILPNQDDGCALRHFLVIRSCCSFSKNFLIPNGFAIISNMHFSYSLLILLLLRLATAIAIASCNSFCPA